MASMQSCQIPGTQTQDRSADQARFGHISLILAQIISDLDMKKNVCIVHEVQALMAFLNILILLHFEIRAMRGKDS